MVPTFKDVFRKLYTFKNSIYNSITDYISLTNFITSFHKNNQFCFVRSNEIIDLILSKEYFNE